MSGIVRFANALADIADNEDLRVTVKSSVKGAGITAIGALLGGLVGGRRGLLAGGTIGALAATAMAGKCCYWLKLIFINSLFFRRFPVCW